jgi:hypothetical protein
MFEPMTLRSFLPICAAAAWLAVAGCSTSPHSVRDTRCYELRTYYAAPGKLDDLNARFRQHTMKLFAKHGMENVAYWMPIENPDNRLIYLLSFPSRAAREEAWKAFGSDPEWKAVAQATEGNGRLVTKVDVLFLETTDFSPKVKTGNVSRSGVFELRTYTTPPGRLPNLDARFRDHTVELFKQHGIKSWAYFHELPGQPGSDTTLLYFLIHPSQEAAKSAFDAFRADPAWIAARAASEQAAGGPLTVSNGVKSVFLRATDNSPTK